MYYFQDCQSLEEVEAKLKVYFNLLDPTGDIEKSPVGTTLFLFRGEGGKASPTLVANKMAYLEDTLLEYPKKKLSEIQAEYTQIALKGEFPITELDPYPFSHDDLPFMKMRDQFVEKQRLVNQTALVVKLLEKEIIPHDEFAEFADSQESFEILNITIIQGKLQFTEVVSCEDYEAHVEWLQQEANRCGLTKDDIRYNISNRDWLVSEGVKYNPLLLQLLNHNLDIEGTYQEGIEWWLVDSWLAENLLEEGECLLDTDFGIWWRRTTSGQAVSEDYVIHEICKRTGWYDQYKGEQVC